MRFTAASGTASRSSRVNPCRRPRTILTAFASAKASSPLSMSPRVLIGIQALENAIAHEAGRTTLGNRPAGQSSSGLTC
jgi:hypothetical protein